MARPRKKPDFDPEKEMEELIDQVASEYGVFDDRDFNGETGCCGKPAHTSSLNHVARKFGLNVTKTRKLLITAGAYSTAVSRLVQSLNDSGASVREIAERTGLSKSAVTSYLPYGRIAYRLNEVSPNADRLKLYRDRKQAVDELAVEIKKAEASRKEDFSAYDVWHGMDLEKHKRLLWNAIRLFQGYWFEKDGVRYRYSIDAEGMHFMGMDSIVTREDVDAALKTAEESSLEDEKVFYLYPVFQRLGVFMKRQESGYIV